MCTLLHVLATPPFCPKTVMNIALLMMNYLKHRVLYLESNSWSMYSLGIVLLLNPLFADSVQTIPLILATDG